MSVLTPFGTGSKPSSRDRSSTRILLTALIYAADRVDSTTGLQMAYVKDWAPRSFNPLELREPELYVGPGRAVRGDATELAGPLGEFDLAYLDPRTTSIATIRTTTSGRPWSPGMRPSTMALPASASTPGNRPHKSVFNRKREMPPALQAVVET